MTIWPESQMLFIEVDPHFFCGVMVTKVKGNNLENTQGILKNFPQ